MPVGEETFGTPAAALHQRLSAQLKSENNHIIHEFRRMSAKTLAIQKLIEKALPVCACST